MLKLTHKEQKEQFENFKLVLQPLLPLLNILSTSSIIDVASSITILTSSIAIFASSIANVASPVAIFASPTAFACRPASAKMFFSLYLPLRHPPETHNNVTFLIWFHHPIMKTTKMSNFSHHRHPAGVLCFH